MFKKSINSLITSFRALFISLALIISACSAPPEDNNELEKEELKECFLNCDTIEVGKSIGCAGAYYKMINEKFILKITPHTILRFDSCQTIYLDSINGTDWAHILFYNDPRNFMENTCQASGKNTSEVPSKIIPASYGTLIIEHTHETIAGKTSQYTTILIKHVFFKDPVTGEKIEVENELIWKVLDAGN
jgi:starvation-inducible outer membrane lipoprotein